MREVHEGHVATVRSYAPSSPKVLACSAALAFFLGLGTSTAAGGSAAHPGPPPRATLTLSISRAHKLTVAGVARCLNSALRHGARGAIVFSDGATQVVHLGSVRVSHSYRFGPPYTVRLTCRGTNGRVASKSVTVDLPGPRSP